MKFRWKKKFFFWFKKVENFFFLNYFFWFKEVLISVEKKKIFFGSKKLKFRWKKKFFFGQKSWKFRWKKKLFFFWFKKVENKNYWKFLVQRSFNLVEKKRNFFLVKKVEKKNYFFWFKEVEIWLKKNENFIYFLLKNLKFQLEKNTFLVQKKLKIKFFFFLVQKKKRNFYI